MGCEAGVGCGGVGCEVDVGCEVVGCETGAGCEIGAVCEGVGCETGAGCEVVGSVEATLVALALACSVCPKESCIQQYNTVQYSTIKITQQN